MDKRRVVVTGIGGITPVGNNMESSWEALKNGVCGIGPITNFDASGMKAKFAAEVKNYTPEAFIDKREARHMDRSTQFAMIAAAEAVQNSKLAVEEENLSRCGVIVSSGIGGLQTMQNECIKGHEKGWERISPFFIPMVISNMPAGQIAIKFGFKGMCVAPVAACAGGGNAVGDAFRHIRDGYAEVMLCGGTEATITELGIGGFTSMKALSFSDELSRASIPFDKERNGFVMGEGAVMLVLEDLEHAQKRGAPIAGEIVGYGATCDAYHITAPDPQGAGGAACMAQAIEDAGITCDQIDYINAHGTATPMNDVCETKAIQAVFGERAQSIPVSSTKSMTGHMLGAAGAMEAAVCIMALKEGFLPPTIHYQVPDEECNLDVVPNTGRAAAIHYALSNSLGFGGHNTCLIFKSY